MPYIDIAIYFCVAKQPGLSWDFQISGNKTTEEEEDIMALIKKHKIPVEEVSKSEKPRPAQINPYNSNAQKISEYFTQEEVASKYGNYSGIGINLSIE